MDIRELQPIIDLLTNQEERLVKKIDAVHADIKLINGKVAQHGEYITSMKAVWKFILVGITLSATIISIWFLIVK